VVWIFYVMTVLILISIVTFYLSAVMGMPSDTMGQKIAKLEQVWPQVVPLTLQSLQPLGSSFQKQRL
jgi:hypothetical protein